MGLNLLKRGPPRKIKQGKLYSALVLIYILKQLFINCSFDDANKDTS
jgi:hypothetical protein